MEHKLPLTLCVALALAGCSTLRAPVTPTLGGVQAPPAWAEAPANAAARRNAGDFAAWWRRFGDTTLDALIADALAANTDIAQAQATLC
jgi:outer membrane protein TolC